MADKTEVDAKQRGRLKKTWKGTADKDRNVFSHKISDAVDHRKWREMMTRISATVIVRVNASDAVYFRCRG